HLVARRRRDEEAERQVDDDEDVEADEEGDGRTLEGHVEEYARGGEEDDGLHVADEHVGQNLAQHDFHRADRGRDQHLHGAALGFFDDGDGGDHHHGHTEDDGEEPRHDVGGGLALGIVLAVDDDRERRGRAGRLTQRALQRFADGDVDDARERGNRTAGGGGIGRVGGDEDFWRAPADHVALEVLRDDDDEIGVAAPQRLLAGFDAGYRATEIEIGGVLHAGDDGAGQRAVVGHFDQRGQVPRVGVDGKAEQHELDDGQPDHHREGDAIAAHLDELLEQHRAEAVEREEVHSGIRSSVPGAKLSCAPAMRYMKAS